ncbi:hypothetical protein DPMN_034370 [Dreissena polymorpha]|uniref:Malonyl-CoA:ACP transacylase (MAT) domain-containing protein n=1 Tax=Dreissena polymorpha TaxID=45954 RepID=A0A9D4M7S1_DREPO|nr:hypothetical protein DPMN_034370 [Dreissena polymorpha]
MNVKPSGLIGHSSGEILCAYVAGCLTAREAIFTAYWCGRCIEQADLPKGRMAAIGTELCSVIECSSFQFVWEC